MLHTETTFKTKKLSFVLSTNPLHFIENHHQPSLATYTSYYRNKTEKQKQMTIFWAVLNCKYMTVQGKKSCYMWRVDE